MARGGQALRGSWNLAGNVGSHWAWVGSAVRAPRARLNRDHGPCPASQRVFISYFQSHTNLVSHISGGQQPEVILTG